MKAFFVIFVILLKLDNSKEVGSSGILKDDVIRKAITRRSNDGLTWHLIRILVDEKRERKQLRRKFRQMKKTLDDVQRELDQRNKNLGDIKFQRKKLLNEVKSIKGEVKSELKKYLKTKLVGLAGKTTKLTKSVTEIEARIKKNSKHGKKIKKTLISVTSKVKQLEDESSKKQQSGAIYIRWGKLTCPNNTELIYAGQLGGTHHGSNSGPPNSQCLPDDPDYREHLMGTQGTYIYGGEYELHGYSQGELINKKYLNYDVVCAACQSRKYTAKIMIPGKSKCYDGWHMEYRGYLMGGFHNHVASNFICVDAQPDIIPGTNRNNNEGRLYTVESICGSLKCPPYKTGYELTCVVCTR